MRILLSTSGLSQTALFDSAVREGVTRILDLGSGVSTPPVLSGITRHTARLTPVILQQEIVNAPASAVLLVLLIPRDLDLVRQIIGNLTPTTQVDLLIGVTHAV